jgi:hypothetical protein
VLPHIGPSFPEAVARILASPTPIDNHSFIFRDLVGTEYPDHFPTAVAKLTLHLLRSNFGALYDLDQVDTIVRKLAASSIDRTDLFGICDELARIGYPGAKASKATIEDSPI